MKKQIDENELTLFNIQKIYYENKGVSPLGKIIKKKFNSFEDFLADRSNKSQEVPEALLKELNLNKDKISNMKRFDDLPVLSSFESPYWKDLIGRHYTPLVKSCEKIFLSSNGGKIIPNNILISSVALGDLNGAAIKNKGGGYIILLNEGIFQFFHVISKTLALFFPKPDVELHNGLIKDIKIDLNPMKIELELLTNNYAHTRFLQEMLAYLYEGNTMIIPPKKEFPFDKRLTQIILSKVCERFILAHELAHIICKHHEKKEELLLSNNVSEEELIVANHKIELEADYFAIYMTIFSFMDDLRIHIRNTCLGIRFLFSTFTIINHVLGIGTTKSHPHINTRIKNFDKTIEEILSHSNESHLLKGIKDNCFALDKTYKDLFIVHYKRMNEFLSKKGFHQISNPYEELGGFNF